MSHRKELAFVGVDTHKHQHTLVLCNCWQDVLLQLEIPNDPRAFPGTVAQLQAACPPGLRLVFGIEGSGGYGYSFTAYLKSRGFPVKEINATLTDRQRLKTPHPDKSDPIDARAITRVLIDRYEELPEAGADERAKVIQELVAQRDVLVRNRTRLRNRLHALLYQQYPNYRQFFWTTCCKTALAFWERFPSPSHLKGFGVKRLVRFLRKQGHRRVCEAKLSALLNSTDKASPPTLLQEHRDFLIRDLAQSLRQLDLQIDRILRRLKDVLALTGQTLTSMDGVDTVGAAKILAHVDIRRICTAAKLARHAGVAPLDRSSGKTKRQKQSKAGCRALNHALYIIAVNQLRRNPLAIAYFQRKRAEGKSKSAAIRCLMRRLCDVIFALLRDQTPYRKPYQKRAV